MTVVGLSAGSLVPTRNCANWPPIRTRRTRQTHLRGRRRLGRSTFNANRFDKTLGYQYQTAPETKYNTVVVTAEYDGFADFRTGCGIYPVANAHMSVKFRTMSPACSPTSKVDPSISPSPPTPRWRDDELFHPIGAPATVELLPFLAPQKQMTIIDTAYKRNDGKARPRLRPWLPQR